MQHIVLRLGVKCNENCVFCCNRYHKPFELSTKDAFDFIDQIADNKVWLNLSGGEPTLRDDLFQIISYARSKGLKNISLQTNGLKLNDVVYAKRLIDNGITDFFISLHSHRPDISEKITNTEESFYPTIAAIQNVSNLNAKIRISHVITSYNYMYTPQFVKFISSISKNITIEFSYPTIPKKDSFDYGKILPRISDVMPPLKKSMAFCIENKIKFGFTYCSIPLCFLDEYKVYSGEYSLFEKKIENQAIGNPVENVIYNAKPSGCRIKTSRCIDCIYSTRCNGIYESYIDLYGEDEVIPVTSHLNDQKLTQLGSIMIDDNQDLREKIKILSTCNNKCIFCSVDSEKSGETGDMSLNELITQIDAIKKNGATELLLYGGEPTLHRNLFEVLEHIYRLNFRTVHMQTNGRRFHDSEFTKRIARYNLDFTVSLHGHTPELHDLLTGADSYIQTVGGIKQLIANRQKVKTNTVVQKLNAKYLKNIAELLINLGVPTLQFALMHPYGCAKKEFSKLAEHIDNISPNLLDAIRICKNSRRNVYAEGFPLCSLGEYRNCATEKTLVKNINSYAKTYKIDDYRAYLREHKMKDEKCSGCILNDECEGFFKEYGTHNLVNVKPILIKPRPILV